MRRLWRWLKRFVLVALVVVLGLLSPVAYVEGMCRGTAAPGEGYRALIAPEHHRTETRTLMTYPEWDIVHAYEDYAEVIATSDPHDFGFFSAIGGFWSSLCTLSRQAGAMGAVDTDTKQMVYVIGVSFTAELLLKAAYEETIGRGVAALRGPERSALDDLSAAQAGDYARFLQQVPWYKWDFRADAAALTDQATPALRDRERRVALGLEYRAKAAYADVIAQAVAQVGGDALTLRMIVAGLPPEELAAFEGVEVVAERPEGIEVETPRYRALTHLLVEMAGAGATFVEIAGNDDILLTALSGGPDAEAVFSRPRQGFGDWRHLFVLKVSTLAEVLRGMEEAGLRLEHIHDY